MTDPKYTYSAGEKEIDRPEDVGMDIVRILGESAARQFRYVLRLISRTKNAESGYVSASMRGCRWGRIEGKVITNPDNDDMKI